ncbi:MAG: response regulator [Alphaproteobacteria bacterium]
MKILIVEDDLMLGKLIKIALEDQKFIVDWVIDKAECYQALSLSEYQIIILDINLPDGLGSDILKTIRLKNNLTPVLVLTAVNNLNDKINALNSGADDYLTKPFDLEELFARILSINRRSNKLTNGLIRVGNFKIDLASHQIWLAEQLLEISAKDFLLLKIFLENPNKVISKAKLENAIYNLNDEIQSNTIEVHIHNFICFLFFDDYFHCSINYFTAK